MKFYVLFEKHCLEKTKRKSRKKAQERYLPLGFLLFLKNGIKLSNSAN